MKNIVSTFLFVATFVSILNAQSVFNIGKSSVVLPEEKIYNDETAYSAYTNYLKFSNDSIFYYETYINKSNPSYNRLTVYACPLSSVDLAYTHFSISKYTNPARPTEMSYSAWIDVKYEVSVKKWPAVVIKYDSKGKKKESRTSYIYMTCKDESVFNLIKSNIK